MTPATVPIAAVAVAVMTRRADVLRNGLGRDSGRLVVHRALIDRVGRLHRRVDRHRPIDRHGLIVSGIAIAAAAAAGRGGGGREDQGRKRRGSGNDTHTNRHQRRSPYALPSRKLLDEWGFRPGFNPARRRQREVLPRYLCLGPGGTTTTAGGTNGGYSVTGPGSDSVTQAL